MFRTLSELKDHGYERHCWGIACGASCCLNCEFVTTTYDQFESHCRQHHHRPPHFQADTFDLIVINDIMPVMIYTMVSI